jgi:hypothetical protein
MLAFIWTVSFMISQFCFEAKARFTNDFAIDETGIDLLISIILQLEELKNMKYGAPWN